MGAYLGILLVETASSYAKASPFGFFVINTKMTMLSLSNIIKVISGVTRSGNHWFKSNAQPIELTWHVLVKVSLNWLWFMHHFTF